MSLTNAIDLVPNSVFRNTLKESHQRAEALFEPIVMECLHTYFPTAVQFAIFNTAFIDDAVAMSVNPALEDPLYDILDESNAYVIKRLLIIEKGVCAVDVTHILHLLRTILDSEISVEVDQPIEMFDLHVMLSLCFLGILNYLESTTPEVDVVKIDQINAALLSMSGTIENLYIVLCDSTDANTFANLGGQ